MENPKFSRSQASLSVHNHKLHVTGELQHNNNLPQQRRPTTHLPLPSSDSNELRTYSAPLFTITLRSEPPTTPWLNILGEGMR